ARPGLRAQRAQAPAGGRRDLDELRLRRAERLPGLQARVSAGPRRRASPLEYAYAAALAALAVAGLLAPDRPPQTPRWQGPFPVHRLGGDAERPPPVRVHERSEERRVGKEGRGRRARWH